ncbi:MAG: hypothetical protein IPP17_25125 [Bacteroidetes bacterium]|nr:hypothetical protein [Bacteroidota bacterium]
MRHLSTILCFLLLFSSLQAQKPGDIVARTTWIPALRRFTTVSLREIPCPTA